MTPEIGAKSPRRHAKPGTTGPRSTGRLQRAIDEAVRREIAAALRETGGNVVRAAQALGISQPGLYKRLTALGIDPAKYRR
jgi:DNA-binding NtrC family response regulator